MTVQEMVKVLVDKGHARGWAEIKAKRDEIRLHAQRKEDHVRQQCSVCRDYLTELEMDYHYHPCE